MTEFPPRVVKFKSGVKLHLRIDLGANKEPERRLKLRTLSWPARKRFLIGVASWYVAFMDHIGVWIKDNWVSLLQSVGIVGSLLFTAGVYRRDARARRVSDHLSLAHEHRELWSEAHRRHDLQRIFQETVDLVAHPLTTSEQEFLNLVFVHFETGWQLAKEGVVHKLRVLSADVSGFLKLPLAKAVWEQSKGVRNPDFVRFVEAAHPTHRRNKAWG